VVCVSLVIFYWSIVWGRVWYTSV